MWDSVLKKSLILRSPDIFSPSPQKGGIQWRCLGINTQILRKILQHLYKNVDTVKFFHIFSFLHDSHTRSRQKLIGKGSELAKRATYIFRSILIYLADGKRQVTPWNFFHPRLWGRQLFYLFQCQTWQTEIAKYKRIIYIYMLLCRTVEKLPRRDSSIQECFLSPACSLQHLTLTASNYYYCLLPHSFCSWHSENLHM